MTYRYAPPPQGACPRCRQELSPIREEPGVRFCAGCGGVLADVAASARVMSRLDRVLLEIGFRAGLGKVRPTDDGRRLGCPECLLPMQRVRVESAACTVDACPLHGTWFDAGELEDVMRAYANARRAGAHVTLLADLLLRG